MKHVHDSQTNARFVFLPCFTSWAGFTTGHSWIILRLKQPWLCQLRENHRLAVSILKLWVLIYATFNISHQLLFSCWQVLQAMTIVWPESFGGTMLVTCHRGNVVEKRRNGALELNVGVRGDVGELDVRLVTLACGFEWYPAVSTGTYFLAML